MGTLIVNQYLRKPFLLDVITDASLAYSLRQLNSTVENVIKVRRTSDNAELDFTAGEISDGTLVNWVGVGNDGTIVVWYDQSGNSRHLSQSDQNLQPLIVENGVLSTLNSLPAINHLDDHLNSQAYVANDVFANTAFTVGTVFSSDGTDSGWTGCGANGQGGIPRIYFVSNGFSYRDNLIINWNPTFNTPHVNTYSFDGVNTCKAWHDGLYINQATKNPINEFPNSAVVSTNLAKRNMKAQELVAYSRSLTPSELTFLQQNQADYHGVELS